RLLRIGDDPGLGSDRIGVVAVRPTEEEGQVVVDLRALCRSGGGVERRVDVLAGLVHHRGERQVVGLGVAEVDVADGAFGRRDDLGDTAVAVTGLRAVRPFELGRTTQLPGAP